jgi:hypothetical protein
MMLHWVGLGRPDDGNTENNQTVVAGTVEIEFESKTIVGQVKKQSKRSLVAAGYDKSAHQFGIKSFKNRSVNGYSKAMYNWYNNLPVNSNYRSRPIKNSSPSLLLRLVK